MLSRFVVYACFARVSGGCGDRGPGVGDLVRADLSSMMRVLWIVGCERVAFCAAFVDAASASPNFGCGWAGWVGGSPFVVSASAASVLGWDFAGWLSEQRVGGELQAVLSAAA